MPKLREYKELLGQAEREVAAAAAAEDGTIRDGGGSGVVEQLGSKGASVYKGMTAYAQHLGFVNELWMVVEDAKGLF